MLLTFMQRCQQKYFYERNIGLGLATNFFLIHKQNVYPRLGTLLGTFYCFKLPHGANLRLHQLIINIMHSALLHHTVYDFRHAYRIYLCSLSCNIFNVLSH